MPTSRPLRLLLGNDAVDGLREHHEELLAEVTEWEQLSRSTTVALTSCHDSPPSAEP